MQSSGVDRRDQQGRERADLRVLRPRRRRRPERGRPEADRARPVAQELSHSRPRTAEAPAGLGPAPSQPDAAGCGMLRSRGLSVRPSTVLRRASLPPFPATPGNAIDKARRRTAAVRPARVRHRADRPARRADRRRRPDRRGGAGRARLRDPARAAAGGAPRGGRAARRGPDRRAREGQERRLAPRSPARSSTLAASAGSSAGGTSGSRTCRSSVRSSTRASTSSPRARRRGSRRRRR